MKISQPVHEMSHHIMLAHVCVYCTVGVQKKLRILFRRTAVAKLKKRYARMLKNGRSVRPRYRFNLSRSPYVSLKEI